MSSTNRGSQRSPADYYPTPPWCVHRLLEAWQPQMSRGLLEPCAGNGAIIKAVNDYMGHPLHWRAIEIEPERKVDLQPQAVTLIADCTTVEWMPADVVITNPPFGQAEKIIRHAMGQPIRHAAFLLRLNFLEGAKRSHWLRMNMPSVYVLPNRPSFKGDGKADSIAYAWFVWDLLAPQIYGKVRVLDTTPKEVRRGHL